MPAYGNHPTRYGSLSNDALNAMYRHEVFHNLKDDEKLDLMQETVNRDCLERGMVGSPEVRYADLPSGVSGSAGNGVIKVNSEMVKEGTEHINYGGRVITHEIDDYNIQTLNTVLHENTHCFQDQIIDGTITIEDQNLTNEYIANSGATVVFDDNGQIKGGSSYMRGVTNYNYYYFQPTERDAYLYAEAKTDRIVADLRSKFGNEPSFDNYDKTMLATGYQAQLQKAAEEFNNPNFDKEVSQAVMNHSLGTNVKVDPAISEGVKTEMIATYDDLVSSMRPKAEETDIKETNNMNINPTGAVSLEDYEAGLTGGVQTGTTIDSGVNTGSGESCDESIDF